MGGQPCPAGGLGGSGAGKGWCLVKKFKRGGHVCACYGNKQEHAFLSKVCNAKIWNCIVR